MSTFESLWLAGMPLYILIIGISLTFIIAKYEEEYIYYPSIGCSIFVILHVLPMEEFSLYAIISIPSALIVWVFTYFWKKVK
ncbi:hypothetical protein [Shouchella patagoniensis]|uniref:hypothetical protein n=1 Tax=Shouchella patagoniensis TaxID=228576 RepID=UPI000995C17E|nr:hypothetical protein [Shouchella patagoniensis]